MKWNWKCFQHRYEVCYLDCKKDLVKFLKIDSADAKLCK